MKYDRPAVHAPRLSGMALKAFVAALESGAGSLLAAKLVKDSGLDVFRATSPGLASPIQVPLPFPAAAPTKAESPTALAERAIAAPFVGKGDKLETVAEFARAYTSGRVDPVAVFRRIHQALEDGDLKDLGYFIARKPSEALASAEASAERHRKKRPLSVFDGVPVVIKDELDIEGFPTTLGTKFLTTVATKDAAVVARLKAAGAIIVGKANMHEIGINPVGINPHHGVARNPYDPSRITGGSSSGSAATVAAGIAPISIGADGGGSVRIPAALCGVVGLKATFGRIPESGVPPLCWNPGHVGPLGLTVADVAATYALIAGSDPDDPTSWHKPPVDVGDVEERSLSDIRLGVCTPYFDDAEPDVVARCREGLRALVAKGATLVELEPPDLSTILWSHTIIILSEMATAMLPHTEEDVTRFGYDVRANLALGRFFKATDRVHAMRHRHRITRAYLELMKTVDAIVTPTTAMVAPPIPEEALPHGESNLPVVDALMRFIRIGNLTGFPAISVPVGYSGEGLPVGLHLLARPYEEHLLFRLGRAIEASVERRLPRRHVSLLEDRQAP
jgi:Asp-tRNA(Asn)/Glu-tRNA(Gln) amidotransferase A subunit family amidase